jgi:RNA polymerase sigma-54 factor
MRPRLDLRLTQKLVMTPQLQQAIKLLQLTRLELTQEMNQQLLENPLLEDLTAEQTEEGTLEPGDDRSAPAAETATEASEDDSGNAADPFGLEWEGSGDDQQLEWRETEWAGSSTEERLSHEQTVTKTATLHEHLLWQLSVSGLDSTAKLIGTQIIGNIDDDGYLRSTLDEIAAACQVAPTQVEEVLRHIQVFDPSGVGARTLQECLLIQIRQLALHDSIVDAVVMHHVEELEHKDYAGIARQLECPEEDVVHAAHVIERLEPKPGRPFTATENQLIIPDVFIVKMEGDQDYRILLNDDGLPRLRVNAYYRRLLRMQGDMAKSTRSYLEERFRSAMWFIRSIEQRNRTICRVTECIVKLQRDFLDRGLSALKPLVLRQVAEEVGLHESTISRVTTNKYAQTPQGLLELKFFFNGGIASTVDGEDALSRVIVKEMIRQLVVGEDPQHPLRDEEIMERLRARHIDIARRTIAKYRSGLQIPPAGKRKRVRSSPAN